MPRPVLTAGLQPTLDTLQTGDVLLYRTRDWGASFNSYMQRSKWSHVAVIVRCSEELSSASDVFPSDYANPIGNRLTVFEAVPIRGVSLFPMEHRLARTVKSIGNLAVRRRKGPPLSDGQQAALEKFVREVKGRNLEVASSDMVRACLGRACGTSCVRNSGEDWEAFFCSELTGESLQQLGVLREEGVNSNDFLPASFASASREDAHSLDHNCLDGTSYGDEEYLIRRGGGPLVAELKRIKQQLKQEAKQQRRGRPPPAQETEGRV